MHYLQEYESGDFRRFDYGKRKNENVYGQNMPTNYDIENIEAKTYFYYGDNDRMASVEDVLRMAAQIKNIEMRHIPIPKWNHFDFVWSINVKEMINDPVRDVMLAHDNMN